MWDKDCPCESCAYVYDMGLYRTALWQKALNRDAENMFYWAGFPNETSWESSPAMRTPDNFATCHYEEAVVVYELFLDDVVFMWGDWEEGLYAGPPNRGFCARNA